MSYFLFILKHFWCFIKLQLSFKNNGQINALRLLSLPRVAKDYSIPDPFTIFLKWDTKEWYCKLKFSNMKIICFLKAILNNLVTYLIRCFLTCSSVRLQKIDNPSRGPYFATVAPSTGRLNSSNTTSWLHLMADPSRILNFNARPSRKYNLLTNS